MNVGSSLFVKILSWFFLNLIFVVILLAVFFSFQSQIDMHSLLGKQGSNRMRAAAMIISHDLSRVSIKYWQDVLSRHAAVHRIDFVLVLSDGSEFSSNQIVVPKKLKKKVLNRLGRMTAMRSDYHDKNRHGMNYKRHNKTRKFDKNEFNSSFRYMKKPLFITKTQNPKRYWSGVIIPVSYPPKTPHSPAFIMSVSDSVTGNGFYFDPFPWMVVAGVVIVISVFFWIPMIRHITKPLAKITRATQKVGQGNFNISIDVNRADEIGRLARTINHMSKRLSVLVNGQKRFLGDVAHELGSPIARIQFGLSALEQRVEKENKERVTGILEDIDHMSKLVNELLSFTRAEMKSDSFKHEKINLYELIESVVKIESGNESEFIINIDPKIDINTSPELLKRAIGNLIRNSFRYAGKKDPIEIRALKRDDKTEIEILDRGPGVPDDLLDQIFEPFFRPEPSRNSESGGVGLGLAIVKTSTDSCNGSVSARNRRSGGFAVKIVLNV